MHAATFQHFLFSFTGMGEHYLAITQSDTGNKQARNARKTSQQIQLLDNS